MRPALIILICLYSLVSAAQVPGFTKKIFYKLPIEGSYHQSRKTLVSDTNFVQYTDSRFTLPHAHYSARIKHPLFFTERPDSSFILIEASSIRSKDTISFLPASRISLEYNFSSKTAAIREFKALANWLDKQKALNKRSISSGGDYDHFGELRKYLIFSHHLIRKIDISCNRRQDDSTGTLNISVELKPVILPDDNKLFFNLPLDSTFDVITFRALSKSDLGTSPNSSTTISSGEFTWTAKDPSITYLHKAYEPKKVQLQIQVDKDYPGSKAERYMRIRIFLYYDNPREADKEYLELIKLFEKLGLNSEKLELSREDGGITYHGYGKKYIYTAHPLARTILVTYQPTPPGDPYIVTIELVRLAEWR
jgi:hypothetical protein